jgi:SLT domain-containing protein
LLKISDAIYGAILPGTSPAGGAGSGLRGDLMKELKGIPAMANGGIVTGPTLALIGEAGPEAVIPLDRMGGMGGNNVTINVQGADPNAVVDALRTYMFRNGSVPIRVS